MPRQRTDERDGVAVGGYPGHRTRGQAPPRIDGAWTSPRETKRGGSTHDRESGSTHVHKRHTREIACTHAHIRPSRPREKCNNADEHRCPQFSQHNVSCQTKQPYTDQTPSLWITAEVTGSTHGGSQHGTTKCDRACACDTNPAFPHRTRGQAPPRIDGAWTPPRETKRGGSTHDREGGSTHVPQQAHARDCSHSRAHPSVAFAGEM